jgi:hypothetical protein
MQEAKRRQQRESLSEKDGHLLRYYAESSGSVIKEILQEGKVRMQYWVAFTDPLSKHKHKPQARKIYGEMVKEAVAAGDIASSKPSLPE